MNINTSPNLPRSYNYYNFYNNSLPRPDSEGLLRPNNPETHYDACRGGLAAWAKQRLDSNISAINTSRK